MQRSGRPHDKIAAAVRANKAEDSFRAGDAKGTFKGADTGVGGMGREVAVAAFAART